ncbi:helix-turn-helix transcriptional regulator, partial [Arthrobacter sp. JCM 19049]|uniref:response regulator transcription factor n=1 Tax=Arthrobacter sp. JCM 19049 TaxID=1460643 RepID=UPI002436F930
GQERPGAETSKPGWTRELTKRESQVALLAIEGRSNQEIARVNGVSIRTVEGHLYQVYSKLQVRNRQELTALDRASRRTAGQR